MKASLMELTSLLQAQTKKTYFIAILFLFLNINIAYFIERLYFTYLIINYIFLFIFYIYLYKNTKTLAQIQFLILISLLARAAILFAEPQLSDDIYRFIWDGKLATQGIAPFDYTPLYIKENMPDLFSNMNVILYEKLNSKTYYTIYPPVCQGVFYVSSWLSPQSLFGNILGIKFFLLLCETGSILLLYKLLKHLHLPLKNALLYALNPLIILEIVGNAHFEGAMICFFYASYLCILQEKRSLSALAFALSIASKLLTLLFLPFFMRNLHKKNIAFVAIVLVMLFFMFLPMTDVTFIKHFGESLDLYFHKFEYNGSLYYLLRALGYQWKGYNMIAEISPILLAFTLCSLALLWFFSKSATLAELPRFFLFAITIYLLCATTVHPWYAALPIALCTLTPYRYPIVWSGLIFFTYINYSYAPFWENLWVVALEYSCLALYAFWEIRKIKQREMQPN